MISSFSLLALSLLSTVANAQISTVKPGYLSEFKYQVADVGSMNNAQSLLNTETHYFYQDSICAERADIWAFVMNQKDVKVGKVFLHFTKEEQSGAGTNWAYHVAPYVIVNGEEMVLDSGFPAFHNQPVPLADWMNYFAKTDQCVVLDPAHNPQHLKYEQNNLPFAGTDPNTSGGGAPRQYPGTEGECYVRKVPAYYSSPREVYGADLALAGDAEFSDYVRDGFNERETIKSCEHSMLPMSLNVPSCKEVLKIGKYRNR